MIPRKMKPAIAGRLTPFGEALNYPNKPIGQIRRLIGPAEPLTPHCARFGYAWVTIAPRLILHRIANWILMRIGVTRSKFDIREHVNLRWKAARLNDEMPAAISRKPVTA